MHCWTLTALLAIQGPTLELELEVPFDGSGLPQLHGKALRPIAGMAFTGNGRRLALTVTRYDQREFDPPLEVYGVGTGAGRATRLSDADSILVLGPADDDKVFALDDQSVIRIKTLEHWMRLAADYRKHEEGERASGAAIDPRRDRAFVWWDPKNLQPGAAALVDLGKREVQALLEDRRTLASVAWHPRGERLALSLCRPDASGGGSGCIVRVIDRGGEEVGKCRTRTPALALAFSPDGAQLVACESRRILWLDPETGEEKARTEQGAVWWAFLDAATALSHDGRQLTVWNTETREPGAVVELAPPAGKPAARTGPLLRRHPIVATALSRSRDQLAVATQNSLRIYRIAE